MTILKFKDLSTSHLTDGDVDLLDNTDLPVTVMKYEYGWVVSTASLVSEEFREEYIERFLDHGMSEEFIAAAVEAARNDCWLLRFDADADPDDNLPQGGYGVLD